MLSELHQRGAGSRIRLSLSVLRYATPGPKLRALKFFVPSICGNNDRNLSLQWTIFHYSTEPYRISSRRTSKKNRRRLASRIVLVLLLDCGTIPGELGKKRKSTRRAQEAMYRRELEEAAGVDQWDADWKTDLNPVA